MLKFGFRADNTIQEWPVFVQEEKNINAIVIICCFFFFHKTFDLGFPQFYCLFNPKKLIKLKEAISQKKIIPPVWKKNVERLRS